GITDVSSPDNSVSGHTPGSSTRIPVAPQRSWVAPGEQGNAPEPANPQRLTMNMGRWSYGALGGGGDRAQMMDLRDQEILRLRWSYAHSEISMGRARECLMVLARQLR
ncbi:unnamed protein product, partial [Discosporangium mesarthrocarpum]